MFFLNRSRVTLLLAVFTLPAVQLSAQSSLKVPYTADTLANGLILVVHEDHSTPIVTVNTLRRVGSGDEQPGRTGFAHLYEHLMFMGSEHAPYPTFDRLLEAVGANNNAYTSEDRTVYYEWGPSNALPLMLWLEADRTGWVLSTMDSAKVDLQRDVVKNERRQRIENQPYGLANETILRMLYPDRHPYHWPVIGSMADLSAATLEDVKQFFRRYYAPDNTTIVVAGDVKADSVRRLVRGYFGRIPRGPAITRPAPAAFALPRDTATSLEDRVQLPRLYYTWHTVKRGDPDDAPLQILGYILTGAKNSRLTQPMVYERQIATDVEASQDSKRLDGDFSIVATARPGKALPELQAFVDQELSRIAASGPTPRELQQAKNATEASFLGQLEQVSDKAEQMNQYLYYSGEADYFQKDLDRFLAVTGDDVRRVAGRYLLAPKVILSIVPEGKRSLGAGRGVQP
ncbi:MAG: M16 family metallopeptidase [Gemmatimonadales bacterium]